MRVHWDSWLLRAALVGTAVYQLLGGNTGKQGALVALEGFVVSLIPLAVARLSRTHVPRALEFAFVLGMALQFISESAKLFELFYYWDKIVHPTLVALTSMIAAWLLMGYRDAFGKRLPVHLGALFGMLLGMAVGAFWEFIEFSSDWFGNANLQKSNGDTITDLVANNTGALLATLLALWMYTHRFSPNQRREMGQVARWLAHGPTVLLRRHGGALGALLALAFVAVTGAAVWIDRDAPALASDLPVGASQSWQFTDAAALSNAQVLSGDWVPDPRGVCRENLDHPRPGSEKMGLLELAPGSVYGADGRSVTVEARYFEERPPKEEGSEMDAGIAFGIRDPANFDLLEQSALHDILRLDHYIHDRRRDVREKLFRTHGNEWHTLGLSMLGSTVTAAVDGEQIYSVSDVPTTAGGIGLWARGAAATCFSDVTVSVGAPS